MLRFGFAACGVVLVLAYAIGSGLWVQTSQGWYLSLAKPGWQPPPWVFGLVWSYSFVMLATVGVIVAIRAPTRSAVIWLAVLAVTVALGVLWAWLFYGPHALIASALALTLCALLTLALLVIAGSTSPWLALAMAPYQGWLLVAASLSWGYVVLNPS